MGDYVVQADLEAHLGSSLLKKLSNTDQSQATVNAAAVTTAIETAESEINAYIGAKYSLPLASPLPVLVKRLALRLARFYLYDKHPALMTQSIRDDYAAAIKQLEGISKGLITLGLSTSGTVPAAGASSRVSVRSGSATRRLTRDDFEGF